MLQSRPLPGGAVVVSLTAPADIEIAAASLRIAGRPPSGGWLFHRGRLPQGRQRCTWIGRAAVSAVASVILPDGTEASAALDLPASELGAGGGPGPDLSDYANEYLLLADRLAFLRQLVESAPSILKLKGVAEFERLRRTTFERILAEAPELAPIASYRLSDRLRLFLFDAGAPLGDVVAVHVAGERSLERSPFTPVRFAGGASCVRALLLAGEQDAMVGLIGTASMHRVPVSRSAPALGRGDLLGAVGRMGAAGFDLARYLIAALAPYRSSEPATVALVRELGLLMPAVAPASPAPGGPVTASLDLALATADGTLVLGGRIDDPHDLVERLEWCIPGGAAIRIPKAALRLVSGPPEIVEEPGGRRRAVCPRHFLAVTPAPTAAVHFPQHGVDLVLRSGARLPLASPRIPADAAGRRDRLLEFLKEIDADDGLLAAVAPVVAGLHAGHLDRERIAEIVEIGRPRKRPEVSVVIPLYKVLSFLRHQAAAFAFDVAARDAEFVLVLDSPEQRDELHHVLCGLASLYGIGWRLVVHTANLGYAPAVNTGALHARGRTLVLLNSDVVPADDRWLPALRRRLASREKAGAVGPKLLYGDDSLQHAGLTFAADERGRYYNTHFFKGYPRSHPAANRARRVPGLTGACIMVDRQVFRSVGGVSESYVVGDFEDSDFSLRLAADGRELWYEPAAELYHYERESISRNASYADTAACRFNQHIHTQRWKNQLRKIVDNNLRL